MLQTRMLRTSLGIPVVFVPMTALSSVTCLLLANTGSRYEQKTQEGIAHFLEHMVFKGTKNFPTPQILASEVDGMGADFNAFTSKEYTGYYVKSASEHVGRSLNILSDMLLQPLLKQDDIDREKGVIIEEINMYVDNPMYYIGMQFEQMMFRGSGLSHDIIGSKATVSSLTSADFEGFLSQWYGLGNLTLVVAGDSAVVDGQELLEIINSNFQKLTTKRPTEKVSLVPFLEPNPFSGEKLHVEKRATEQAHLIVGWPSISRSDERKEVLSLLHTLLGGNMSSRLFSEVREKRGLCYYVHSDVDYYHNGGVFGASAGVDPKRVHEAILVIKNEFFQLAHGESPVTEEEVQKAKDHLLGKITLGLEDSRGVAQYVGLQQVLESEIEPLEKTLEKIKSVTAEQIQALASELVRDGEMRLGLIGPYDNQDEFEKYM